MYRNYPWTRARTVFAKHPVSCFIDVDENARSGHPPIIFIMKESRRLGRGGWRWRRGWELKTEKQAEIHLMFGGATAGSWWKRTRTVNDVLRGVNCQHFFPPCYSLIRSIKERGEESWPPQSVLLMWLIMLSFPGGFQNYFNNFMPKKNLDM